MCDLETIGTPSTFRIIRIVGALTRMWPTFLLSCEDLYIRSVHYESIKQKLNRRLVCECPCDERLKGTAEGSTLLTYTMSVGVSNFNQKLFIMNR